MTYYFDVKETFIKTIAIEADNLEQAEQRVDSAWHRGEFEINREYPDDVEFNWAQEAVENCIKEGDFAKEELTTFNCNDVVYDDETDSYVCPVCGEYAADRWQIKDMEYPLSKHCHECGTKLHY